MLCEECHINIVYYNSLIIYSRFSLKVLVMFSKKSHIWNRAPYFTENLTLYLHYLQDLPSWLTKVRPWLFTSRTRCLATQQPFIFMGYISETHLISTGCPTLHSVPSGLDKHLHINSRYEIYCCLKPVCGFLNIKALLIL